MSKITAIATRVPPYKMSQQKAKEFVSEIFSGNNPDINRLLSVFDNSGIETRYFSCPVDWFKKSHTLSEKNEIYIKSSVSLSQEAALKAFYQAECLPEEIDYIIYVNTTGLATPSIDARLINCLELKNNIRRTPIWGLGCAGGVAGLAHAHHYLCGHPRDKVLLISAELCGLTFLPDDHSKSNLVATALFGEGAAAVLLTGDEVEAEGIGIVDTYSRFYPDSLDVMGWNIVSEGMQVVFAKRIPEIVETNALSDFSEFLNQNHLTLENIQHYIIHPGGKKVIEAYEKALSLSDGQFELARGILRDYGNMSSVTVLFVLESYMRQYGINRGELGIMSALGPGFSSESLLLKL